MFNILTNFLGCATNLDSFLKPYMTSETKGFFPYEWFNHPDKLNEKELPPYEAFHNKLRNSNPLGKEYLDYEKLIGSGLTTESSRVKMRLSEIPPTWAENYFYLQKVWEQEKNAVKDFLRCYNNVVPALAAMQKTVEFNHNKGIDMLKLVSS